MARRPGRSLIALLSAALLVSCSSPGVAGTASPPVSSAPPIRTTSTVAVGTTTTTTTAASTTPATGPDVELIVPDGEGPFPAVVLVHGGGWVAGSPASMRPLARHLADNGFLVVNTRYHLTARESPGFPVALDDVACAVRFAATHPDGDGTVAIVGHSAGAHLGAVVALNGDAYGGDCTVRGHDGLPDSFIGLAGPYDVTRLEPIMRLFFGSTIEVDPDTWTAGNPLALADENPDLSALIMYGENDGLVDDLFALGFHTALLEAGAESLLEVVEGARHLEMHDPEVVGDLIVTWLER